MTNNQNKTQPGGNDPDRARESSETKKLKDELLKLVRSKASDDQIINFILELTGEQKSSMTDALLREKADFQVVLKRYGQLISESSRQIAELKMKRAEIRARKSELEWKMGRYQERRASQK